MPNQKKETILVVDDSSDTRELIKRNLKSKKYTVFTASSAQNAVSILANTSIDLLITDLKMPKVDGLSLIRHVKENFKNIAIMMITGYATIPGAVQAIKAGSEEFLAKPFTDEELFTTVARILKNLKFRRRSGEKQKKLDMAGLIGESACMQSVYSKIIKSASSSATVLITGESGTGKELVARAVHYNSSRMSCAFIPVHCAGIPQELIESELFGHLKGSFTNAYETRAGFFQTADEGTIFLDEIAETPLSMQVKLLRVLQDKEIYMVGSRKSQKINTRIVAATNKVLSTAIENGTFREDLYFRLNVINIKLPPLRDRGDDIFLLINHFTEKFAKELGKPAVKFSDKALNILRNYNWPGNVRELENIINQIVVMNDSGKVDTVDLPSLLHFSAFSKNNPKKNLQEVISEHVLQVLENVAGNKSKASKILGIDRKTLRKHLEYISTKNK
ncbi:MAG: sigma-54-dependent Fis family transcriptional regulator [Elusimicrobiales bacterium]|nr:sigma-54-dependent Fis family transcriptional regulator [Elusimicrobiales bacterium]